MQSDQRNQRRAIVPKRSTRGRGPSVEFAGLKVFGAAAQFLKNQEQVTGNKMEPSPIQELAIVPIYKGQSVILQAPTGTGKSLSFLLPLLLRLEEDNWKAPRSGLRLLVLVPTGDLQVQMVGLIRALIGPERAQTVVQLRRDKDNSTVRGMIAVATANHICDLLEDKYTSSVWGAAVGGLDMLVIDECDRQIAKFHRHETRRRLLLGMPELPAVRALQRIVSEINRQQRRNDWQLVGASATVNRTTKRRMRNMSGIDLDIIRAPGLALPTSFDGTSQHGDWTSSWPAALTHTMKVVPGFHFPAVMIVVSDTILDLKANRVLVAITPRVSGSSGLSGRVGQGSYGLNQVTAVLRSRLEAFSYKVTTASAAVEAAADRWLIPSDREDAEDAPVKEVIISSQEQLRGIHIDKVDAVIILGDPVSVTDYLHTAGRTCRYQSEVGTATAGSVVTVTYESVAYKLMKWGKLAGFSLQEVPLEQAHAPVAPSPLQTRIMTESVKPPSTPSPEDAAPLKEQSPEAAPREEGHASEAAPAEGQAPEQTEERMPGGPQGEERAPAKPKETRFADDLFVDFPEDDDVISAGVWG